MMHGMVMRSARDAHSAVKNNVERHERNVGLFFFSFSFGELNLIYNMDISDYKEKVVIVFQV